MAYRPPSKWSKSQDISGASANISVATATATAPTDDGWQTVGRSDAKKWGQSALKKPEPKYEDLFPTLSTKTISATTSAPDAPKVLTLAERMKRKMAEEEEQKRAEEEEARMKAEEEEKNRISDGLPISTILRSRQMQIAKEFRVDYTDPEDEYQYGDRYGEGHYEEDSFRDGYGYSHDDYDNGYNHSPPYEYNDSTHDTDYHDTYRY